MNNLPRNLRPQKKKTRGTLKIATLNIRGAGSPTTAHKWRELNHRIKFESLSIVALQETHSLSDEKLDELNNKHGYRMHILHSGDPDHPQARGIAVVLNKYTTRWQEAKAKVVIPGRAMRVELPWNEERKLNILAIYAPNTTAENTAFWKELNHKWIEGNIPKPDIMLGDFNIVEESIDREPKRRDPRGATEALDELKSTLKLVDAWRLDHPKTEVFTWEQTPTRESKSRIDRIYLSNDLRPHTYEWAIDHTEIRTDHKMVSVKIYNPIAPIIGKGRWSIPLHLLKDKDVKKLIDQSGKDLLEQMINPPAGEEDLTHPQKLFQDWKSTLVKSIRNIAREKIPRLDKRIASIK
ncbi:Endonuclease/exonuclease/phosphatase, partial [Pholiota molesta]